MTSCLRTLHKCVSVSRGRFFQRLHRFILFEALRILKTCNFQKCFRGGPRFVRDIPFTVSGLQRLLGRSCPRCPCLYAMLQRLAGLSRFCSSVRGRALGIGVIDFTCGGKVPGSPDNGNNKFIFSYHTVGGPNGCRHCGRFAKLSRPIVHFLRRSKRVAHFLSRTCRVISTSIGHCVSQKFAGLVVYFNYAKNRRHSICSTRRVTRRVRSGFNIQMSLMRERRGVRRLFGSVL